MKNVLRAAVAASALMLASPAWSNIVEATPSDENGILVHGTGPVQEDQVVEGQLGIGGMQVDIGNGDTSAPADEYRMQQGQGQATVTGAEISGNDYYDMQSMNIWLDDGTNFSWIELSLFGEPTGADLHFVLTDNNGDTFDFYGEILNGETKFAFEAVDGQLISNLFWEVTDGAVTTVKQIRIDPGVAGPTVPEPSTWAMMLMGFGFAGVAMRRRRRDNGLAQLA
jgi:hypothetical protein